MQVTQLTQPKGRLSLPAYYFRQRLKSNRSGQPCRIRLSAVLLPAYYPQDVVHVSSPAPYEYLVQTSVGAITGHKGVLPRGMVLRLLSARFSYGNTAPIDFFDIFNHRYLTLYCQTHVKYFLTAQFEQDYLGYFNKDHGRFSCTHALSCLVLPHLNAQDKHLIPPMHLFQFTGVLGLKNSHSDRLKDILETYFGLRFHIRKSGMIFSPLMSSTLTQIGQHIGQNHQLNRTAFLGKTAPMFGQIVFISVCPDSYNAYLSIYHDPQFANAVKRMVNVFLGVKQKCQYRIRINPRFLPRFRLGDPDLQLGRTAWLTNAVSENKGIIEELEHGHENEVSLPLPTEN